MQGQIIKISSNRHIVSSNNKTYNTIPRGKFRKDKLIPKVGDYVRFNEKSLVIEEILPRKNTFNRPMVSNIDRAFIITSLINPDFSLGLLDKFIAHMELQKIDIVICLTKTDLVSRETYDKIKEIMVYYTNIGYTVLTNLELEKIKELIKDKTVVFIGQTGAGKSTLLNKLNPDECVVCGKLTQGIPFIVYMADLDLDLTRDDVLGEHYQFIPAVEDLQLVKVDEFGNKIPVSIGEKTEETPTEQPKEDEVDKEVVSSIPVIEQPPIEVVDEVQPQEDTTPVEEEQPELNTDDMSIDEDMFMEDENSVVIDETPSGDVLEITEETPDGLQVFDPSEMMGNGEIYQEENPNNEIFDNGMVKAEDSLSFDTVEDAFGEHGEKISEPPVFDETLIEEPLSSNNEDLQETIEEPELNSYDEQSLTEDDLDFLEDNGINQPQTEEPFDIDNAVDTMFEEEENIEQNPTVPVYPAEDEKQAEEFDFKQGDRVSHHRYGRGVIEKIITYGNKTLCSISFENVGRRLLDPTITDLTKIGGR